MELISVIVPVYQAEKYIDICVESILSQTYQNLEVILVDDGSNDSSVVKCDYFCKADSRVKVIHKKNGGVASARNTGLEAATGEYIMFVDSDDWVEKNMIADMLAMAKDAEADIVECDFVEWKGKETFSKPRYDKIYVLDNKEEIFYHSFTHGLPYLYKVCWGKLIRSVVCSDIRFPNRTVAEDAAFCDRVLLRCNRVVKCYAPYYHYRITPGSIMHSGVKSTVFETLDTVLEMEKMLRKDDYCYSTKFWKAFGQHISNCATGIADQIILKGYRLTDIEGFDVFYKKCQEIEKTLSSTSNDFHCFVQDYHKWERFRRIRLLKRQIMRKISKLLPAK